MQVIYADTLFVINLVINYLILLSSAKLCALQISRVRLGISAAVGGVYSVLTLIYPFCQQPVIKIAVGIFMVICAFGNKKHLLKIIITFFCISAAFAGIIYGLTLMTGEAAAVNGYIFISFRMLIFSFGISYFIISVIFKRTAGVNSEIVNISVLFNGRKACFNALIDTGHSLTDPVTGSSVIITNIEAIRPLFKNNILNSLEKPAAVALSELEKCTCPFRLIPYSTIGVINGMLIAFKPDMVYVNKKKKNGHLVAISPTDISDGGVYSALIGVG